MEPITSTTILFSLFFLFIVATLLTTLALKKKKDLLMQKLMDANDFFDQIREELKELQEKHEKDKQFHKRLSVAELTTHLQKPRLSAQTSPVHTSTPEKYRLVYTLTRKNMHIDEIASFLSISIQEAQQLVTLSKLVQ